MTGRVSQADYQADQCVNCTDFSRKNSRNFLLPEVAYIDSTEFRRLSSKNRCRTRQAKLDIRTIKFRAVTLEILHNKSYF